MSELQLLLNFLDTYMFITVIIQATAWDEVGVYMRSIVTPCFYLFIFIELIIFLPMPNIMLKAKYICCSLR